MSNGEQLFLVFIRPLNRNGISYMVTGSAASMAYGVPRVTLDVDLVLEITAEQANRLPGIFPPDEFYCPPPEVISVEIGRAIRGHFNIIQTTTGFKADCYPIGCDPLHRWAMARRRLVEILGEPIHLAPPEYVIVRKLEYFREGGSEKHLRDIRGMLEVSPELISFGDLEELIAQRHLSAEWARARDLHES